MLIVLILGPLGEGRAAVLRHELLQERALIPTCFPRGIHKKVLQRQAGQIHEKGYGLAKFHTSKNYSGLILVLDHSVG